MRFCVLASGSKGNATYVEGGGVRLLIDAGISCRALEGRLAALEVEPGTLDGILVTHEHSDHIDGLYRFAAKHKLPVYANEGTAAMVERQGQLRQLPVPEFAVFESRVPFALGDLAVQPIRISHDTAEPVAFTLADAAGGKLGYFTDLGYATQEVATAMQGCTALVLESNHDEGMLRTSGRPYALITRIAGRVGHLSNDQACELMQCACPDALSCLVLAHLSHDCNAPDVARAQMSRTLRTLGRDQVALAVARQDAALALMEC